MSVNIQEFLFFPPSLLSSSSKNLLFIHSFHQQWPCCLNTVTRKGFSKTPAYLCFKVIYILQTLFPRPLLSSGSLSERLCEWPQLASSQLQADGSQCLQITLFVLICRIARQQEETVFSRENPTGHSLKCLIQSLCSTFLFSALPGVFVFSLLTGFHSTLTYNEYANRKLLYNQSSTLC